MRKKKREKFETIIAKIVALQNVTPHGPVMEELVIATTHMRRALDVWNAPLHTRSIVCPAAALLKAARMTVAARHLRAFTTPILCQPLIERIGSSLGRALSLLPSAAQQCRLR